MIAIENVRPFKELQERNAELREALEHQTATAEVLGIISRSPTDVQPVLDAIVECAARVWGSMTCLLRLREGKLRTAGTFWLHSHPPRRNWYRDPRFHWMCEHGTLHIPNVREQNEFPFVGTDSDYRTFLALRFFCRGNSLTVGRASHRGASLHPGADRAA